MQQFLKCLECGQEMKNITWTHLEACCGLTPKEYKKKHNVESLFSRELRSRAGVSKEGLISKYGKEEGIQRWKLYRERQVYSNSLEYKKQKHGMTEEEFEKFNKSRAVTLENMVRKYGKRQGLEKFNSYREKQRDSGCSLKYFIEKYGEEDGSAFYQELNSRKAWTFENFKRRNPEATIEDFEKTLNSKFKPSKPSRLFFATLITAFDINPENVRFEFGKYDEEQNRYYFYDFVDLEKKICIEYNGDIYHANPKIYKENDIPPFRGNSTKAKDIWEADRLKSECIVRHGFDLVVIWDSEVKESQDAALAKMEKYYGRRVY